MGLPYHERTKYREEKGLRSLQTRRGASVGGQRAEPHPCKGRCDPEMLQTRKGLCVENSPFSKSYLTEIKRHNLSSEKEAGKIKFKDGSDEFMRAMRKKAAVRPVRLRC